LVAHSERSVFIALARRLTSRRRRKVKAFLTKLWQETDGVLSFEWTVLTSLLTVGVVSGVTAVRDATVDEFGDVALSMVSLDQSYYVQPPLLKWVAFRCGRGSLPTASAGSRFADAMYYADCTRAPMRMAYNDGPSVVEHDWDPKVVDDGLNDQPRAVAPPSVPVP
jgi:Flp pilus assembly pilin Flp